LLTERFVRYADIQIVEQRGANLHINNVFFVRAATASFAATLAELVRRLAAMPEDQRAAAIDAALARHLDAAAVNERVALFRGCAADLQISCSLLFFWVFVLAPLLVLFDSSFPLIAFLGSYIGIAFLAVQQFHHAHTFLYPHERADRWKSMLVMSFSPADLLHARDKLAHGLLAEFHPLAATAALCRPNSFQTLAAYTWRDLNYPLLPICPAPDTGPQQTEEWFRKRLRRAWA
jgi:hypothetical protein